MIRTYLDSGVLIEGVRGLPVVGRSVYDLLEDPEREFVASVFLRLEILPKAIYHRAAVEADFYQQYFERVVAWAGPVDELVSREEHEAVRFGLSALDALHVAAAGMLGADELVTTEGPRKLIHRATNVRVVAIR